MDYSKIKTYNSTPVKVMSYKEAIKETCGLFIVSILCIAVYILVAV